MLTVWLQYDSYALRNGSKINRTLRKFSDIEVKRHSFNGKLKLIAPSIAYFSEFLEQLRELGVGFIKVKKCKVRREQDVYN